LFKRGASRTLLGKAAKGMILEQIEGLDTLEEVGLLDEEEMRLIDSLKKDFDKILFKEEKH